MRRTRVDDESPYLAVLSIDEQPSSLAPPRRRSRARVILALTIGLAVWVGLAEAASHLHSRTASFSAPLPIGGYPLFNPPGWQLVDQRSIDGHQLSVYRLHNAKWCWDLVSTGSYGTLSCQRRMSPPPKLTISFLPPDPGRPATIVLLPAGGAPNGWADGV